MSDISSESEWTIASGDYIKSLDKSIQVIRSFKNHQYLTISDSSKITGLSRPVTRRILLTLEYLGYTKSKEGRFYLTPKMFSLGYSYMSSQNIWEVVTPFLEELSGKLNEASSLAVLDDTEVVYISRVPVNTIMQYSLGVGTRLPAHLTSIGKMLLAHLSPTTLDLYFNNVRLDSYTENTLTSEEDIRAEIETTRRSGYAVSQDQLEMGLLTVAAPIRDIRGEVVAAINCTTHSGRTDKETFLKEYLPEVLRTAEKINSNIDYEIIN